VFGDQPSRALIFYVDITGFAPRERDEAVRIGKERYEIPDAVISGG
jgi:hypothetical protein